MPVRYIMLYNAPLISHDCTSHCAMTIWTPTGCVVVRAASLTVPKWMMYCVLPLQSPTRASVCVCVCVTSMHAGTWICFVAVFHCCIFVAISSVSVFLFSLSSLVSSLRWCGVVGPPSRGRWTRTTLTRVMTSWSLPRTLVYTVLFFVLLFVVGVSPSVLFCFQILYFCTLHFVFW